MTALEAKERLVPRRPFLAACALMLLAQTPSHGYELAERLREWGFEFSGPGSVYRVLRLLEEDGLVHSRWALPVSGPVPRVYEVTAAGRRALNKVAVDLEGIEQLLVEFHGRHQSLGRSRT